MIDLGLPLRAIAAKQRDPHIGVPIDPFLCVGDIIAQDICRYVHKIVADRQVAKIDAGIVSSRLKLGYSLAQRVDMLPGILEMHQAFVGIGNDPVFFSR